MRGFTLIETIFSSLIISLVVLTIFNLFPSSMTAIKRSETEIQAGNLAQSQLEGLRTLDYDGLTALRSSPPSGNVDIDGTTYNFVVAIADVSSPVSDPNRIQSVSVTVTWTLRNRDYEIIRETWMHAIPK